MDSTYKKYATYTVEDFLQDDFFITSVLEPTAETDEFWKKALEEKTIPLHDYKLAHYFIHSVQAKRETVTIEETYNLWESIEVINKANIRKKKRKLSFYLTTMAASAALLAILLFIHIFRHDLPEEVIALSIEEIEAPIYTTNEIQLILADNEAIALEGKEAEITYNQNGIAINNEGTELTAKPKDKSHFNQLVVPFGKRSMLTFAEGSRIWINAGTRIVYPIAFSEKNREIYIDGEAYLEVAKDEQRPFIVKTRDLSVKVLGTSFNIMAYENDTVKNVILVEGSVMVNTPDRRETFLAPNDMYQLTNNEEQVKKVNVKDYISWKDGIYRYEREYLEVITKRLSRYYGEEIICTPEVARLTCSGKLDLKDDLTRVLKGITLTAPVTYSWQEGKYRLQKE